MYWRQILKAVMHLNKTLRHEARVADRMLDMQKHAVDYAYYLGKKDAYRDAASKVKDVYETYRVR